MASEVLLEISRDEVERVRLMSEYKYQLDMQSKLVYAEREARKKGREEGEKIGEKRGEKIGEKRGIKKANLENALAMKRLGISIENICTVTGLSTETIEKL